MKFFSSTIETLAAKLIFSSDF